jgi:hypothetical protein
MSLVTLSATLPSEFVSTATVGTSADWLVIQKSGENYLRKIPASASAFGAANLAATSIRISAPPICICRPRRPSCATAGRAALLWRLPDYGLCLHFKVYAPGIGFSPLTASISVAPP